MIKSIENVLGDGIGKVELLSSWGSDKTIVNAARVSFGKDDYDGQFTEKDSKLLKYLLWHEHGSPFEHTGLQYRVKAPLFVHAQWVKHRSGVSINSQSGRYTELVDEFYIPATFRQQAKSNKQASIDDEVYSATQARKEYESSVTQAYRAYQELLKLGVAREQARGVLPQCAYTTFIFTCNIRSLLHFLHLRNHSGAQWEMQQYAKALKELAEPAFPHTFAALFSGSGSG